MLSLACTLVMALVPSLQYDSPSRAAARLRAPPLVSRAPRLRVAEIKERLAAAGVSTAGIVEKEELVRLLDGLEEPIGGEGAAEEPTGSDGSAVFDLDIAYMQGGAYATFDEGSSSLRLLIDTGAAVSLITAAAGTVTLRSRRNPSLALPVTVAPPQYALPPGVDGILGVDSLRRFAAVELDWASSRLLLHTSSATVVEGSNAEARLPFRFRRVAGGELPFVRCSFGPHGGGGLEGGGARDGADIDGLVDTGSPVTMVTAELAALGSMVGSSDHDDDILASGVDGQPTRMRAMRCKRVVLGEGTLREGTLGEGTLGAAVTHADAVCYAGTCSMMAKVGWEGTPAALLGLDVLRSGVRAGQPPPAAAGGPRSGRLLVDFANGQLRIAQ